MSKIVSTLNLKISPRDLKNKDNRQLLCLIFSQWLSLAACTIQSVIDIVPSPLAAQAIRVPKMLYPNVFEQDLQPKNKLESDLFTANSTSSANVVAYVSKMFAVPCSELPENKGHQLNTNEMRSRSRGANETKTDLPLVESASVPVPNTSQDIRPGPEVASQADEVMLGFARLYSGTIELGTRLYAVLPKYNASLPPDHLDNVDNIVSAEVKGLYVMMGRQLSPVKTVRAGNTFAIRGLGGKVWRNATLCAPVSTGIPQGSIPLQCQSCLISLGGASRTVRWQRGRCNTCS